MSPLSLKPTHKPVKAYYEALKGFKSANISHESAVRSAFQELLNHCCHQVEWKLIPEFSIKRPDQHPLRVDGAMLDDFEIPRGYWEAKDSHDDLEDEVGKKFQQGYPKDNIIFQAPDRAILWQGGKQILDEDITKPDRLVETLHELFRYRQPVVMRWEEAATEFKEKIPELAKGLLARIEEERKTNQKFIRAFTEFLELCRHSINPNLSIQAVEEMLIQHLLTERIFRTVFQNSDFTRRNIIAAEIEKVIEALTSKAFSRQEFLNKFDRLYVAIEAAADSITDFAQKQHFLNTVYEKFFQGFSVKVADTHGIVYTPQPIVNFMVKSVEEILQKEFGRSLSDKGVHILDPFVGTGTFIVRVMQEIKRQALTYKYQHELHCNEVMLLPYYIASMNIEHEFFEKIGEYKPFEGICLVDTFELAEPHQAELFTTKNTERVEQQKKSPIFVIMGNPPYNAWQLNENDNNKNRKYPTLDKHVAETYAKASSATNKNALSDPYVKAFRWASERIGDEGIVAFVSNNSFLGQIAFDGMREHLAKDFDAVYVLDLGGNVRKNPKLSGTTHNVFGIQVGVSITLLVRKTPSLPFGEGARVGSEEKKPTGEGSATGKATSPPAPLHRRGERSKTPRLSPRGQGVLQRARIFHARVDEFWRKEEKYHYLDEVQQRQKVEWKSINPDEKNTWLTEGLHDEFEAFPPMGTKEVKANESSVFIMYSNGVKTHRDAWAYNFSKAELAQNMQRTITAYNTHVSRWSRLSKKPKSDDFAEYDDKKLSWSRDLKLDVQRGKYAEFEESKMRSALYRPFCRQRLFFDRILNEEVYQIPHIFPTKESRKENRAICLTAIGNTKPFHCILTNTIPDLHLTGESQCFPFYTYDEDGSNRRENITDWAVEEFNRVYDLTPDPSPLERGGSEDPRYMTTDAETWKHLKPLAREHRKEQTEAEEILWQHLRNKKLGFKFRRQHAIGEFIVDFVCIEKKLVVELDGEVHKEQREYDAERTRILNGRGFRVIRFWNSEVTNNIKDVLARVKQALTTPLSTGEGSGVRSITKADIFHYIYALLHHPTYRERYAANLRRELPRVPFVKDFRSFAEAGKKLATLHVEYEKQKQYKLDVIESKVGHLNYRVEKMKLSKDKKTLIYNDFFKLGGIPQEAFEYRLGNRSALEWIIDQYQISTDKRSGITNDPNRADDPEYIMRLIGQVITVSLETVKIVKQLPKLEMMRE